MLALTAVAVLAASTASKEDAISIFTAIATIIALAELIAHKTREFWKHNWEPFKEAVRELRRFWREFRSPLPPENPRKREPKNISPSRDDSDTDQSSR